MTSDLVSVQIESPNHSGLRPCRINRITPHCVVGNISATNILNIFKNPSRRASCTYAIGKNGEIGQGLDENLIPWTSSNQYNDQRAITIECASDFKAPYAFNQSVFESLVNICVDICKRYNKKRLVYIGDKQLALNYDIKDDEMLITLHRWFAARECPGDWLVERLPVLVDQVNSKINQVRYHTVVKGETLWGIAKTYYGSGLKFYKIMERNRLKTPIIHAGDVLIIPE